LNSVQALKALSTWNREEAIDIPGGFYLGILTEMWETNRAQPYNLQSMQSKGFRRYVLAQLDAQRGISGSSSSPTFLTILHTFREERRKRDGDEIRKKKRG
jgi:hypothetical protein